MVTNGNRNPNGSGTPTRMEGGSSSETAGGEPYDHPMMIDGVEHDMHGMAYDRDGVVRNRRRYNLPTTTGAEYGGDMDDDEWDGDDDSMVRSGMRGSMRGGMDSEGRMGRMARYGGKKRGSGGQGGAEHEIVPMYIPVPMEVGGQGRSRGKSSGGVDLDELGSVGVDTIALINNVGTQEGDSEMFGSGTDNGFLAGLLAGGGANRGGVDASTLALLGQNKESGMWGGDTLAILILLLLLGGGRGFGGGLGNGGMGGCCDSGIAGVDRTVVNTSNYEMLTAGIRGNEQALNALAASINCECGQLKTAICNVNQQLALNQGSIEQALCQCCNNLSTKILESRYETSRQMSDGFCSTNLNIERAQNALQAQASDCCCKNLQAHQETRYLIQATSAAQDRAMAEKFCELSHQIEAVANANATREMQQEIQRLRDERDNQRAQAQSALLLSAINRTRPFTGNMDIASGDFAGNVGQVSAFSV